jgi:putative effector of murein hydrolase
MTRGLQLAIGSSKRAMTERAEELGGEGDDIPMTARSRSDVAPTPVTVSLSSSSEAFANFEPPSAARYRADEPSPEASPPRTPVVVAEANPQALPPQAPLAPPRSKQWASIISNNLDLYTYLTVFIFVGIPVYYATGYAMPIQLSFSILTYMGAMALPADWRQYLHPVLVSSLFTVLGLWVLGLIKGDSLILTLGEYRTGAKYLDLWSGDHIRPGAGDLFASILDASIVALALPMYQYRRELKQHFFAIVTPNIFVSIASLFSYPYICYAIGISAERSLAFSARSLTLALATPATVNLGGDTNTVAALAIMSGILGVLIGQRLLALLGIPEGETLWRTLNV